jgi:hypothetical protein
MTSADEISSWVVVNSALKDAFWGGLVLLLACCLLLLVEEKKARAAHLMFSYFVSL